MYTRGCFCSFEIIVTHQNFDTVSQRGTQCFFFLMHHSDTQSSHHVLCRYTGLVCGEIGDVCSFDIIACAPIFCKRVFCIYMCICKRAFARPFFALELFCKRDPAFWRAYNCWRLLTQKWSHALPKTTQNLISNSQIWARLFCKRDLAFLRAYCWRHLLIRNKCDSSK